MVNNRKRQTIHNDIRLRALRLLVALAVSTPVCFGQSLRSAESAESLIVATDTVIGVFQLDAAADTAVKDSLRIARIISALSVFQPSDSPDVSFGKDSLSSSQSGTIGRFPQSGVSVLETDSCRENEECITDFLRRRRQVHGDTNPNPLDVSSPGSSEHDGAAGDGPVVEISLENAIADLLRNNPFITGARLEWLASSRKAMATWGSAFEPGLTGGFSSSDLERENTSIVEETNETNLGFGGILFSGGTYALGFSLTDILHGRKVLSNSTPYAGISMSQPVAYLGASISQPLLRGAWFGSPFSAIKIARSDREIAFQQYRSKLMMMIYQAIDYYWNLAFAQAKFRFASESAAIARKLVLDSKFRLKTGLMSSMDVLEAEAGLALRLAAEADSRHEFLDAVNQLKLLLSSDSIPQKSWLCATNELFISNEEADSLIKKSIPAMDYSDFQPDYLSRREELKKQRVIVDFQKNQCLPELSLKGSYGLNGVGRTSQTALYRLFYEGKQSWSSAIELRLPFLLGVEARNMLAAEKLKTEIAEKNLKAVYHEIGNTLRILHQRIVALQERMENARTIVGFRQRLLEVEFKKLNAGKSNYRLIFETEEKLAESRLAELESYVRLRVAAAQLAKITGSLLMESGLESRQNGRCILPGELTGRR